jgi:hypothetical protein
MLKSNLEMINWKEKRTANPTGRRKSWNLIRQTLRKSPKYLALIIVVILFTACASERNSPYYQKRTTRASDTNANRLGRNRYYFSDSYQKKLNKSYKRR